MYNMSRKTCTPFSYALLYLQHDDVIKWNHFPRYWPFVRGIHRSPVNSPHKGQWRGAFMFSLMCVWINGRVNKREAGDLRRYRAHYDVIVMALVDSCVYATRFSGLLCWQRRNPLAAEIPMKQPWKIWINFISVKLQQSTVKNESCAYTCILGCTVYACIQWNTQNTSVF